MHNLLNSRKAQFFVLSAFAIITCVFFIGQWIEPYTITDTSSIVMMEEFFIFNNIVEKANETVALSKNCEELNFNLEEYKAFIEKFASSKTLNLNFTYVVISCDSSGAQVAFDITLSSPTLRIKRGFASSGGFLSEWDFIIEDLGSPYAAINKYGVIEMTSNNASEIFEYVFNQLPFGGKVLIKSGAYLLSTPTYISSNIFIKGEGYTTILYLMDHANISAIFVNKGSPNLIIENVTIKDLRFYGNRNNQDTGGAFVSFRPANNVLVENIYIEEATYQYDALIFSLSNNITIKNIIAIGIGVYDGAPIGLRGANNVHISDCIFEDAKADGIWVGYEEYGVPSWVFSKYVTIKNVSISNVGRCGIWVDVETVNTTIENVTIKNSGQRSSVYTFEGDWAALRLLGHNITVENTTAFDDQPVKTQSYGAWVDIVSGYSIPTGIVLKDSDFRNNSKGCYIVSYAITDINITNVLC